MKAFYFRFLDDSGKATGWVGLVVGQTMNQIFDCIDEYGNPYTVQIQAAKAKARKLLAELKGNY